MRLLIIAMILLSAPAMACESYEECINASTDKNRFYDDNGGTSAADLRQLSAIQAIAYKLDEINKSLEYQASNKSFKVTAYHCGVDKINGQTVKAYDCGAWDCLGAKECKEKGWE